MKIEVESKSGEIWKGELGIGPIELPFPQDQIKSWTIINDSANEGLLWVDEDENGIRVHHPNE